MSDREKLIEDMARAIVIDRNGANCLPWARMPLSHKKPYLSDATAALTALEAKYAVAPREPTEEMIEEGRACRHEYIQRPLTVLYGKIYKAMLSAAQKEEGE